METESFTLRYGLEYNGTEYCDGELRLPTVADVEHVLKSAPHDACKACIDRLIWGRTIIRLGDIPTEEINAELLTGLIDNDYGVIMEAENTLRKKRLSRNATED